jgi:hypothetical protein
MNRVPVGVCSCIFCGEQLNWKSDMPYEDAGLTGEGMVVSLECSSCGAMAAFVTKPEEEGLFGLEWTILLGEEVEN